MPSRKLTDPYIKSIQAPEKRVEIYDTYDGAPGLALRVTKAGSKSFVFRYRLGDRVRRFTIGRYGTWSLADAREKARELKRKVDDGVDPMEERRAARRPTNSLTFAGLVDLYREMHAPALRPATWSSYKKHLEKDVLPAIGDKAAKAVTRADVQHILNAVAKRGARTQANRMRATISSIMSFGVKHELLDVNPAAATAPFKVETGGRTRFYNEEEIAALWDAFGEEERVAGAVLKVLLLTGQRRGETSRMRWDDLEDDTWLIPEEDAKNRRAHDVPLTPAALKVIRAMPETDVYVFEWPDTGKPITDKLTQAVRRVRDAAGVEDFRVHDLRRTFATWQARLGTDRTTLAKLLNHKTGARDNLVTAVYDKYDYAGEKRAAMERWHNHIFNEILDR